MKEISIIVGLSKNSVKGIDKKRLWELYTVNGKGKQLKKPTEYSKYLGIDEFLLHKGHRCTYVDHGHEERRCAVACLWQEETDCI